MKIKVAVGIAISLVFVYFAFRKVDFDVVLQTLLRANYLWLLPAFAAMLLSHLLRAVRWHYICEPIKPIKIGPLFSALMVGYAANNIFPLRLGEFVRAYVIGKSQNISKTSSFATIIVDRLLDILSLLLLMAVSVYFLPNRDTDGGIFALVRRGGYVITAGTVSVIVLMVFLMQKTEATLNLFRKIMPAKVFAAIDKFVRSFLDGFLVFKKAEHYLVIIVLSVSVWLLYALTVYFSFFAFNFHLGFGASLVVLVIISLGLMIPSSPGFIGTYHWFCKASLGIYGISGNAAISFAVISHAMNTIPFTVIGLSYFWKENLRFADVMSEKDSVVLDEG